MGKVGSFLSARSLRREAYNNAAATAAEPIAAPASAAAPVQDAAFTSVVSSFLLTPITP